MKKDRYRKVRAKKNKEKKCEECLSAGVRLCGPKIPCERFTHRKRGQ